MKQREYSRPQATFLLGELVQVSMAVLAVASTELACTGIIGEASAGQDGTSTTRSADPPGSGGLGGAGGSGGSGGSGGGGPAEDACTQGVRVGGVPLQRLTREQYANSLRDLLGLADVPMDGIAPDEKLGPFSTNTAAPLTELILDQYTRSAETLTKASLAKARWDSLVPCDHVSLGDERCAAQFIDKFGLRTYRRPLSPDEQTRYQALYRAYATPGYDNGIRVVVQTMLQSPNFLYRFELGPVDATRPDATPLTGYELVTRLSYFLWNTTPDDTLLARASAGSIIGDAALRAEAERMISDERARDTIASFHWQWLEIEGASSLSKDPAVYPAYGASVGDAMRNETANFADYVLRQGDGKLATLFTSSYTIVDDALLSLYGVTRAPGSGPKDPIQLDPRQRAGLLTQASFLTVHAHANQSSPVQRGKIVRKNLLCQPLPDPPPDVNATPPEPSAGATTRERFAAHQSVPSCAGCHKLIDDIGFGFENYDGIGQFRATEGGHAVDATGKLVLTRDLDGPFDGAVELAQKLAGSTEVHACLTSQWFRFALGRMEAVEDACSLFRLKTSFQASGQNVRQLLIDIVMTDAFRFRRGSSAANGVSP